MALMAVMVVLSAVQGVRLIEQTRSVADGVVARRDARRSGNGGGGGRVGSISSSGASV